MTQTVGQQAVVVGVDETEGSHAAIRLAAREASYRDAMLVAIKAYSGNPALGAPAGRPLASTQHTADEQRLAALSSVFDTVTDALGDAARDVELRAVPGLPGRNLVDEARRVNAQLIVLATRSSAMLPGSVSHYVLHKAPCPILVVPEASQAQPPVL
jgi:nucleotide-binding universal stress UspA family protein